MSLFKLQLLKPHTHEGIACEVGEFIHTVSADVAAWLVRHGIAVHAGGTFRAATSASPQPAPAPAEPDPSDEPDPAADLTNSTNTETTGDDHE